MSVTLIYAAIMTLVLVGLSASVSLGRQQVRVALGDGGSDLLNRRIRVQGNFVEYVPLSIILLGILEMHSASVYGLILLALMMVVGRIAHAYSLLVAELNGTFTFRFIAMQSTWIALAIMALWVLYYGLGTAVAA